MKVRMINALDGHGRKGLGQLTRDQAGEMLSELSLALTDAQDRIERAARSGAVGRQVYDPLRSEVARVRQSLVELRDQLAVASTPEALTAWQERAGSMQTSLSLFASRLDTMIGAEPGRRGRMFVFLALGSVVVLGGLAAVLVFKTRKRVVRRRRRR